MSTMTIDQLTYRPAPRRSTVRLTRRGKVVVFLFALLVILFVAFVGAGLSGAAGQQGELATRTVTVVPGDTLWDLASRAAHGGDVRDMEQEIKDLNGLDSGVWSPASACGSRADRPPPADSTPAGGGPSPPMAV